jgi:plasmid stabilization system protein ParE
MKVVVSAAAEQDLREIGEFVARDSPSQAARVVNAIADRAQQLAEAPEAFQLVPRYEHFGMRRRPYKNYLIFYRVAANAVEVVRILHGARDYEHILFGPGDTV